MKCKYCGAELTAGTTRCPACGAEDAVESKLSAGKIALLAVLIVAAVAVVAALIMGGLNNGQEDVNPSNPQVTIPSEQQQIPATIPQDGNPDDVTCKGTYTAEDSALPGLMGQVVATVGDEELTNEELQTYYWMQFYDFLEMYSSYAAYFGLDVYAPLDTQRSLDTTMTWQQYFLDGALDTWHSYAALSQQAKADGFEIPAEYRDELDAMPANLKENAISGGFENAQEMIQADMGPGATLESYMAFMEDYYLGNLYYSDRLEQIQLTDDEVSAYFEEHSEEYAANGLDKTTRFVDVRHILLMPKGGTTNEDGTTTYSDEEWEACRQAAQAVLDEYLAGELTEERFAQLAGTHSEDGGSNTNGGLYTDVYVGQMVEPFENWCFDKNRVTGETGLVKTNYGYHVMYYVGYSEAWYDTAWTDLMSDKADELLKQIMETYPITVDYSAIALGLVEFTAAG